MRFLMCALAAVIGYFLGNISTGLLVSKGLGKIDIRQYGSGNAGTTNMLRTMGWIPSLLTLAGDVVKAVLAVLIGRWLAGEIGVYVASVAVVTGHNWPVLFGFKGGKGIACSLGVILMTDLRIALILLVVQFAVLLTTRYMSMASIASALAYFILVILFNPTNLPYICCAILLSAMALFSHRANFMRLLQHTENRLDFSKIKKITKKL